MKIWIGIPAYDGKITVATARSLYSELALAPMYGHSLKITYLPGCSVIAVARNELTQQFLDDPSKPEKMVFIDSDVGWAPGSLMRLACHNRHMVAGIYRYKVAEEGYPMGFFTRKGEWEIDDNGLITVAGVPMGFTCLSRNGLEWYRDQTPERAYQYLGRTVHAFFDSPFIVGAGDVPSAVIGEDISFSFRWREKGGKCWVDPNMDLIHSNGLLEFAGNLLDYLKRNGASVSEKGDANPFSVSAAA